MDLDISRSHRPVGRGSATAPDPRVSEEARAFLQGRLALLGLVTLCLSASFYVVAVIGDVALDGWAAAWAKFFSPRRVLNLVGAGVSLALWLAARGAPRTPRTLLLLDAGGHVGVMVPYTLMAAIGRIEVLLIALMAMLVLQTRALMVPSPPRRTLGVSSATALLTLGLTVFAEQAGWGDDPTQDGAHVALSLTLWLAVAITVSTIASQILFGLRQQVSAARRLGQYILLEEIGHGGMGVVYRARHAMLRRPTAVKLLVEGVAGAAALARFEREVQLTASLIHPNTVTVFDYGRTPEGVFYYAMEYLDGGDLDQVVAASGPMPAARARHILAQVASGLAEAHEIGLIHRDIKPANVLLVGEGPVADLAKVVDFGLVRQLEQGDATGLTQTNTLLGTPLYMAPEAVTSPDEVDHRADIYALGAVGYFLLTGQSVFGGRTVVEICGHHMHSKPEPPSSRLGAHIPEMLEEIILRCLEKDPAHRPASAAELAELLGACEDVPAWTTSDARAWWREHTPAVHAGREQKLPISGTEVTLEVGPLAERRSA